MARTYKPRKNARKKTKTNTRRTSFNLLGASFFIFSFGLLLWLFWVQWIGVATGQTGKMVNTALFDIFGHSSYLLPLFLLYGLIRFFQKKQFGYFTLFLGTLITISALSLECSFLNSIFTASSISGGIVGAWIFGAISSVIGKAGGFILGIALMLLGSYILFEIKWLDAFTHFIEFVKRDYHSWMDARMELKTKIEEAEKKDRDKDFSKLKWYKDPAEEPQEKAKPKIMRPVAETLFQPKVEQKSPVKPINKEEGDDLKSFDKDNFQLPSLDLLSEPQNGGVLGPTDEEIEQATANLERTLKSFNIKASVTGVSPGPVVTRYEIKPDPGVKISTIVAISNDIALAMKARGIRVEAPIPGKDAIGFEIPNERPLMVSIREILQDPVFKNSHAKLPVALGRHADGLPATTSIESMPHCLIAGATNSGKSICIHTLIMSILYTAKPDEVKFLLIDPKRLELTFYEDIPHLYDPKTSCEEVSVVTNPRGAVKSLQMLVKEMERRYHIFEAAKVKNIDGYNRWAEKNNEEKCFYVVVIIDELADLILQVKSTVEDSIQRLAQMARAGGIHLILSTQRPSVNVITGVIKANLPSRIALQVASKTDSRVILDMPGGESLLGKGDMLFLGISDQKPHRVQGAYVSEEEITKVADFLRAQGKPDYPEVETPELGGAGTIQAGGTITAQRPEDGLGTSSEELIQALTLVSQRKRVSQDLLKAHFGSSARATNILSILEMKGFISKPECSNRWTITFEQVEYELEELKQKVASVTSTPAG